MEEQIAKKAANVPGHVGVVVKNLKSQKIFMLNERHIFNSASIIKLPILCAAYEASKNGLFKLNDRVEFTKGNVYGGNGLINQFAYGLKPTIRDCMVLMIVISDNTATNMVIDVLGGIDNLNSFCQRHGWKNTKVERKLFDPEAMAKGLNNYTSPCDMADLMERLYKGTLLEQEDCLDAISILKKQQVNNKIPAQIIPRWDIILERSEIKVAHKTGDMPGIEHDVGIVYAPGCDFIVSVMTENTDNDSAIEFIGAITKIALKAFQQN